MSLRLSGPAADHHVRVKHDRHECRDHQVDHDAREMALNEPPPPRWCRRRGRRPIYRHTLSSSVLHRLPRRNGRFYAQSASGKSNSPIKRSLGQSHLSLAETRPCAVSRGPARPAAPASPAAARSLRRPSGDRTAKCGQQFPPSDGDCHTPLPREVRKTNDTTPSACSLHVQGGQNAGFSRPEAVRLKMRPAGEGKISSASSHDHSGGRH
jgi:hypothetical protein